MVRKTEGAQISKIPELLMLLWVADGGGRERNVVPPIC